MHANLIMLCCRVMKIAEIEGFANASSNQYTPQSNMGKDKCNANLFLFTSIDESLHQKVISFKEKL